MPSDTPIYRGGQKLMVSMPAYEGIYRERGWSLTPEPPAQSASKDEWVAFAVEHGGMWPHDASQLSRKQLVERFTTETSTDTETSSPTGDDTTGQEPESNQEA